MTSITSTLGSGSGIDTTALVEQLATAAKAPREKLVAARETANTARISSLATVSNSLASFSTALNTLVAGGTLSTQPSSSDSAVLTATAQAGARIGDLAASIEVTQLATAQTLSSARVATADTTAIGQGSLTLATADGSFTIAIGAANDSLSGLARAINASNSGVTASIVTDSGGARLSLKGATGAAAAFTLTPDSGADPGLSAFAYPASGGAGMTLAQSAQDAVLKLDGVSVTRASNTIDDLVPGITLALKGAKPGSTVALGATRPTAALTQAVTDVVDAFNELIKVLNEQTAAATSTESAGSLRNETAIRDMRRQLSRLTSTVLNSGGGPKTLAEIGVSTNRDGTLSLSTTALSSAIAADPDGVEAMFNPGQHSDNPLVKITSPMGRAKAGTYALSGITAQTSTSSAAGSIAGKPAVTTGGSLVASYASSASGLTIQPLGDVASATITVDPGIAGALSAIKDLLLSDSGTLATAKSRYTKEATAITAARTAITDQDTTYRARLTKSFAAMDSRVSAYKATQSFLEQQVKVWTNSND